MVSESRSVEFMPTPVTMLRCFTPARRVVNERLVTGDTEVVGSFAH